MLLRSSIHHTKKFFQKTLGSLKNFFSDGSYQKLPKSPTFHSYDNPFPHASASTSVSVVDNMNNLHATTYKDLDKLYTDFTDQWDSKIENIRRSTNKKKHPSTPAKSQHLHKDHVQNPSSLSPRPLNSHPAAAGSPPAKIEAFSKESRAVGRGCLVEQKLKELEMLDVSNVDHVLDIEEVLHYYSRLTCPAYLEIVEKFFMEMYSEFFSPAAATPARSVNSGLRPRPVRS
ncbi:uncharacterized protein [Pyrus communis]|uniref:uncharacterized protein n=1 Tax=Pyrus communis TaxID=23211 RepID=UPI0035BFA712